jgi:hypothetical protein
MGSFMVGAAGVLVPVAYYVHQREAQGGIDLSIGLRLSFGNVTPDSDTAKALAKDVEKIVRGGHGTKSAIAKSGVAACRVEDCVGHPPSRLVGTLHRREVDVRAHVVAADEEVRDCGVGGGPVPVGIGGVHHQRCRIGDGGFPGDTRIEMTAHQFLVAQDRLRATVESAAHLRPDLLGDLVFGALFGSFAVQNSRSVPVGDVHRQAVVYPPSP